MVCKVKQIAKNDCCSSAYESKDIPNDTRQRIIKAILDGEDQKTVSRVFNVQIWTVRRIMLKYNAPGESNKSKQGGYKPRTLNEEHCDFLKSLIDEDAAITLSW